MVAAGNEDVCSTRESAFTDVSPLLESTEANDLLYIAGTVASAAIENIVREL